MVPHCALRLKAACHKTAAMRECRLLPLSISVFDLRFHNHGQQYSLILEMRCKSGDSIDLPPLSRHVFTKVDIALHSARLLQRIYSNKTELFLQGILQITVESPQCKEGLQIRSVCIHQQIHIAVFPGFTPSVRAKDIYRPEPVPFRHRPYAPGNFIQCIDHSELLSPLLPSLLSLLYAIFS